MISDYPVCMMTTTHTHTHTHTHTLHACFIHYSLTLHTQMHTQQRVPLSLLSTDKPPSETTDRRDFCMSICSAALNQPSGIFPKTPGLSKDLLLSNDHYGLQWR